MLMLLYRLHPRQQQQEQQDEQQQEQQQHDFVLLLYLMLLSFEAEGSLRAAAISLVEDESEFGFAEFIDRHRQPRRTVRQYVSQPLLPAAATAVAAAGV